MLNKVKFTVLALSQYCNRNRTPKLSPKTDRKHSNNVIKLISHDVFSPAPLSRPLLCKRCCVSIKSIIEIDEQPMRILQTAVSPYMSMTITMKLVYSSLRMLTNSLNEEVPFMGSFCMCESVGVLLVTANVRQWQKQQLGLEFHTYKCRNMVTILTIWKSDIKHVMWTIWYVLYKRQSGI